MSSAGAAPQGKPGAVLPAGRAAVVAAGCTALATLLVCGASLLLRGTGVLPASLGRLADLTSSFLVLGVIAAAVNAVVGFVRARGAAPGAATGRPRAGWLWLTALFIALAAALITYLLTVMWLTNALYVALCLVIVCIPAALIFVPTAALTLRQPGADRT